MKPCCGAAEGNRTPDLRLTMASLCRLSYGGVKPVKDNYPAAQGPVETTDEPREAMRDATDALVSA